MAKVTPVLPHLSMTMAVDEAKTLILGLDTLHAWAQDDVPEVIVAFAAQLTASVEQLEDALAADEVEDEGGEAVAA